MTTKKLKLLDGKEYIFSELKLTPKTSRLFEKAESGTEMKRVVALMEIIELSLLKTYTSEEIEELFENEVIRLDSDKEAQAVLEAIFEAVAPKQKSTTR